MRKSQPEEDTIGGLCARIKLMIQEREGKSMPTKIPEPQLVRECDELRKILRQIWDAYCRAVPDWRQQVAE